eukprot:3386362-Lingulodinium_polyedra.AAC.1
MAYRRPRGGPSRRPGPRKAVGLHLLADPRPAGPRSVPTRTAAASAAATAPMTRGTAGAWPPFHGPRQGAPWR